MIRTRHIAGTVVVALVALPLYGISPASAAAGTAAVTGPLYTGNTETVTFVDGDETGAYKIELWKTAKVADLGSGSDITALGTTFNWTIPTGVAALVDTGFKIKVVPGTGATFDAIETSAFAIQSSAVDTVAITGSPTTWAVGSAKTITWDNKGQTGDEVDISVVSPAGKATVIAKGLDNDESESIVLPLKTAAATGYKIRVTPSNKAAAAGDSAAVEAVAAAAPSVAFDDATPTRGQTIEITVTSTSGPVKLDLVKKGTTKSLAVISKSAAGGDVVEYKVSSKIAADTYSVIATVIGTKPVVSSTSGDVVVSAYPAIALGGSTATALSGGLVAGQTLVIGWTSDADGSVSVGLVKGDKETKLDAKEVTVGGAGSFAFVVPAKQAAGTDYKIRITSNDDKTILVNSSTFTISANPTVLVTP